MENKSPGTTKVQAAHHHNSTNNSDCNNKIKEELHEEEVVEDDVEIEEAEAGAEEEALGEASGEEDTSTSTTTATTSSLTCGTTTSTTSGPSSSHSHHIKKAMMISSSTSTPVVGVGNLNHESPGGNNNISPTIVSPGSSSGSGVGLSGIVGGVGGVGGLLNGGSPDSTTHNSSSSTASTSSGFHSSSANHHHRSSTSSSASNNTNASTKDAAGGANSQTNMYSLKWNTQLLALQRSLANLWDNGIGTDAVLLCQGVPLPVHKIILTAASPYVASVVQTMVGSAHMMPVIVLDISAEAGKALLSFLYCGEAHVPVTIIPQLVAGAKFLGISGFGEPGVIESLTGMVPETASSPSPSQMSSIPEKSSAASSFRSTDSPCFMRAETESPHPQHSIPQMQLPVIPSIHGVHVQIPNSVQYQLSSAAAAAAAAAQNSGKSKSSMLDRSKNNSSPYPSQQYIENLIKNGGTPGATITKQYSNNGGNANSKKNAIKNRVFIGGGTSILDNLLKNPKSSNNSSAASLRESSNYGDSPVNLSANNRNGNKKDNDISQYEAQGYADNAQQRGFYYSPSHGHFNDDSSNNMDQDGDGDDDAIPAQLLEPNVEYRIGNEFTPSAGSPSAANERFSHHGLPLMHPNPLIDLAKVASTMHSIQHVGGGPNKRRGVPKARPQPAAVVGENGLDLITSSAGRHSILDPSSPQPPIKIKIKKAQEPIICEICKKKFSNAYNLRVHMEGHSGQVFVCSVCSHASRSRDALRKHFAYRHRELWISGMSAFRKNVPGRKLSISKPNANSISPKMDEDGNIIEDTNNNNDTDSKNLSNYNSLIRGGGDGTLTISELPEQIKAE